MRAPETVVSRRFVPPRPRARVLGGALGLAVALAAASAIPAAAQSAPVEKEFVAMSEPCLNVRPGPSRAEAPVRCLPPGRRMTLLESRGDWARVRLPDEQVGWVALRLLVPEGESAPPPDTAAPPTIPTATPPAPPPALPVAPAVEPPVAPASEPAAEDVAPTTATEEPSPRRDEELQAALDASEAAREELERELAAARERELAAADEWRAQVDDTTAVLRAAELFLAESERQRLELSDQVAALREENDALRELLGSAAPEPVAEPPAAATGESQPEAGALRIELPEAPAAPAEEDEPATEPVIQEAAPAPPPAEYESVSESLPEELAEQDEPPADLPEADELFAIVTAWAKAWSEQRVDDYLSFYAEAFRPAGETREAWEVERRQRVSAPDRIEVRVALLDVRSPTPGRVEIELLESYSSDTYNDSVVKVLEFVQEAGAWKIARERSVR